MAAAFIAVCPVSIMWKNVMSAEVVNTLAKHRMIVLK